MAAHDCLRPPLFMSKSYHTIKMRMFTKNQTKKYSFLDEWRAILYDQHFFGVEPRRFLKMQNLAQFLKWHVTSNYTYQKVINSNMGSKMASLMVSREGGRLLRPPPWEPQNLISHGLVSQIGLSKYVSFFSFTCLIKQLSQWYGLQKTQAFEIKQIFNAKCI